MPRCKTIKHKKPEEHYLQWPHGGLRGLSLISSCGSQASFLVPQNRNTDLICINMHSIIAVHNLPFDNQPVQEKIRI